MTAKAFDVGLQYAAFTVHTTQAGYPVRLTASGQVLAAPGLLIGFYVNNTTSGTVTLYDALSATNAISGLITPAAGFQWFPAVFETGIYAAIGGTLDVTFFIQK